MRVKLLKQWMCLSAYAKDDDALKKLCISYQQKVVNALYSSKIEPDGTFLRLNLTGAHHKRKNVKTFFLFLSLNPPPPFGGMI
jgi:hypothetical protein